MNNNHEELERKANGHLETAKWLDKEALRHMHLFFNAATDDGRKREADILLELQNRMLRELKDIDHTIIELGGDPSDFHP